MKVEVDIEEDQIFRKILLDDWQMVKDDIKRLKADRKHRPLENFEMIDLKHFKKYRKAMEVLITYYFPFEESCKILAKEKKE